MGLLLLGLVVGFAIGFVWGRRRPGEPGAPVASVTPATATPRLLPPVAGPTKRGRKAGLTEDDFRPADDILERLHQAWEQTQAGASPISAAPAAVAPEPVAPEPVAPEAVAPEAVAPAEPMPIPEPAIDPALNDAMRRVFARLGQTEPEKEAPTMDDDAGRSSEDPTPEAAPSAGTVTEGLVQLAAEGYGDDLRFEGGVVVCRRCGTSHATDAAEVERVLRFEGPSDPADEAIILGLRCPECGAKGSLVSAFGLDADPDLAQAFVYLASKARHR